MMRASGGRYRDEATGLAMGMDPADVMTAMAQQMAGGMTAANMASANTAIGNYFSVSDIVHVQPMNPLTPGAGAGASQDARNYGMTLAAMSQYARTINMPGSSALVTAMMDDASDAMMDGRRGASQISMGMGAMMGIAMMASNSGTTGLASAMSAFLNSGANVSGLTVADMAALMQRLNSSNGKI